MKQNILQYLALILLLGGVGLLSGCKDDAEHDDGTAVVVNRFYPTSGSAGTEILITGRNFSTNPEDITVTLGNIPLKVLNSDMNHIMAIVPPKLGDGVLTIKVGNSEPINTIESFTYSFSAVVSTLAGSPDGEPGYVDGIGSEAMFYFADMQESWRRGSICVDDNGNIYVGDCANYCVRKITPDGEVTTLAGLAGSKGCVDGIGVQARFNGLYGMDCDAEGNILMTDVFEWKIRKVTPEGKVTTLGSTNYEPWLITVDKRNGNIYVSAGDGGLYKWSEEGSEKIASGSFKGIAVDKDGNLYAADQNFHGIVRFAADTWERENLVGGSQGFANGSFDDARFSYPCDLAIDSNGDIYVAGNGAWDGGENLDQSIRLLDMANRVVRLVAGGSQAGYVDANASSAAFSGPQDLAVDKNGVIYVYDKMNNAVRKIVYE